MATKTMGPQSQTNHPLRAMPTVGELMVEIITTIPPEMAEITTTPPEMAEVITQCHHLFIILKI
jgi:hypothetical protein